MCQLVHLSSELRDGHHPQGACAAVVIVDVQTHASTAPLYRYPCRGWASELVTLCDHAGTRLDPPYHLHPEGTAIEALEPDSLIALAAGAIYEERA